MYSDWSVVASLAVTAIFIWLGILSLLIWRQSGFLKTFFPKSGERDIRKKFEETLEAVGEFKGGLADLNRNVMQYHQDGLQHIQKVGLKRFNPYDDTGGDQSFTVCLLNNEGSGIVVTSLHARSGTRVFGKEIVSGKSLSYKLSKEEEEVIKETIDKGIK